MSIKKNQTTKKKKGLPDMPDSPDELQEDLNEPGEGLNSGLRTEEVSRELAGDLLNLPFQAWRLVNPVVLPLSPVEQERLAGPFSRILEKYGMGKIAKDEIVFGFYLTAVVYARIKAVRDSKPKKEKKIVANDSGQTGPGQDDFGKTTVNFPPSTGSADAPGSSIHS